MATYTNEMVLSWQEVHRDARILARQVLGKGPWLGLVVITRGGMMPAAIIARELNVRLIETLCLSSYQDKQQSELTLLKGVDLADGGKGWLVVDDLADTGRTLAWVHRQLPKAHVAALYVKPAGRDQVDSFVTEVGQDTWVRFPWDFEMHYAIPLAEQQNLG